jgi:hypothetical protein
VRLASRDGCDETQQRNQRFGAIATEAFDQRGRQAVLFDWWYEYSAGHLPERARGKVFAPPQLPAHHRASVDTNGFGQLPHPSVRHPVLHHRHQHHDGGKIDLAAEKAQRRRRRPAAAAVDGAAVAKSPLVFGPQPTEPRTGFARILRRMQHTAAGASRFSCGIGKIAIVSEQQLVEGGVGQQG